MSSRAATPARPRLGGDPLALRPLADDHQPRLPVRHGGEGADQPRQVLDRAQPGDGADHDLVAGCALEARGSRRARAARESGDRRRRWGCGPPGRRLPPGACARSVSSRCRRHDQPVGAPAGRAGGRGCAAGFSSRRLVLVEAVLMVDERRSRRRTAAGPSPRRTRPNCRSARDRSRACSAPAATAGAASARRSATARRRESRPRPPRSIASRAPSSVRHRAQHDMLGRVAERVHQPHRARLLAAEREGRMAVEDADRAHGAEHGS